MANNQKTYKHIIGVYLIAIVVTLLVTFPFSLWRFGTFVPYVIIWVILANFDKWLNPSIVIFCFILGIVQDLATATYFGTWATVYILTYLFALVFRNVVAIKLRPNYLSAGICLIIMMAVMLVIGFVVNNHADLLSAFLPIVTTFLLTPFVGKYFAFGDSTDE
jgi:rod shape-determining protein MreD